MTLTGLIEEKIALPKGVSATLAGETLTVKGPGSQLSRRFYHPKVSIRVSDGVILRTEYPRKADKALIGTWKAHITNMVRGVTKGYEYTMKIVYSHFPIKTSIKSSEGSRQILVENFLGERHPRRAQIMGDTEVKISGDQIIITGYDKERVGQTAANIEQATKIRRYDTRVFQDGIYIVSKR
jgi:large subunit ribosomal protein L6